MKVNGTQSDSHASVSSQKYSQILGDHHTNNSTNQFNKNSSNYIYKSRGYSNKENFSNQRTGTRPGPQHRSWQRGGNYRTSTFNVKDKKPEENGVGDSKVDSTAEPIKFNEGKQSIKARKQTKIKMFTKAGELKYFRDLNEILFLL